MPYIEEPPETPAPVFAVRAFKTALFGTPHPSQQGEKVNEEKPSLEKPNKPKLSPRAKLTTPKLEPKSHAARALKGTPLLSPAKGILLTPGTAATRRKTVSFGSLGASKGPNIHESGQVAQATVVGFEKVSDTVSSEEPDFNSRSQPALTKELFAAQLDASKQRMNECQKTVEAPTEGMPILDSEKIQTSRPAQSSATDSNLEFTVDLTKPRSQSGQHWKAEYERYQKNSDRELKKIIQYGQNVKSYAEKKDIEATNLQEKLKRELAKCTAMEAKVSKLATQVANGRHYGSDGSAEQTKLMNDLSRQTALAIRYKQKADRYRNAIEQQKLSSHGGIYPDDGNTTNASSVDIPSAANVSRPANLEEMSELKALQIELDALRSKLDFAEERAAKLEAVNAKLTRNFLRVKDEMQNYDARRVRKEARLKQREQVLVAEKRACEAKLKQLTKEHEDLLRSAEKHPFASANQEILNPENSQRRNLNRSRTSPLPQTNDGLGQGNDINNGTVKRPMGLNPGARISQSQDRPASNGPAIDIWTMDMPSDTAEMTPPAADPAINLSHVALSEATHDALREIDNNSVSEFPSEPPLPPDTPRPTLEHLAGMDSALQPDFPSSSEPYPSSVTKRMNNRRNTIASPRPSVVSMASSAVKDGDRPRATGFRRNMSLASAADSRRSTLSGGRSKLGDLPPDRAAAARARLAQRKSMKENRQG